MLDLFEDFRDPHSQREIDLAQIDQFYDNIQYAREQEMLHERALAQNRVDRETGVMCFGYDKGYVSPDEFNPF